MPSKRPLLSIIIPALNEEKYLPALLDSIKAQTFRDYELIVSDSFSEDRTAEIARSYDARLVMSERKGPGYGRNEGASAAHGKYILFLDADITLPTNSFLEDYIDEAMEKDVELGHVLVLYSPFTFRYFPYELLQNVFFKLAAFLGKPFSQGIFIFVSKDIFELTGGFDESMKLGEDVNFLRRANKHTDFHIQNRFIYNSNRRLVKEGSASVIFRYVLFELPRMIKGRRNKEKRQIRYDFGHFDDEGLPVSIREKKSISDRINQYIDLKRHELIKQLWE